MEREENKLTTFSTWTIMLGCNFSSISANLGNSGEATNNWPHYKEIYGRHTFVLFVS